MKKISMMLIVLMLVSLLPTASWAASPWTEEDSHRDKMLGKLDFGFRNVLFGWTEVLRHPYIGVRDHGLMEGVRGLGVGLYHGVADTVGGVLHIVTFPLTGIDVPLPQNGVGRES